MNYFCQCLIVQSLFFVQVAYLYCSTSAGGHVCTLSRLLSVGFFLVTPTCLRARGKHWTVYCVKLEWHMQIYQNLDRALPFLFVGSLALKILCLAGNQGFIPPLKSLSKTETMILKLFSLVRMHYWFWRIQNTLILSRLRAAPKGFSGPSQTPCTHAHFSPGLESCGFHHSCSSTD